MSESKLCLTFALYHSYLFYHEILNLISLSKRCNKELWQCIIEVYIDDEYISIRNKFHHAYVYSSLHKYCEVKKLSIVNTQLIRVYDLLKNSKNITQLFMKNVSYCSRINQIETIQQPLFNRFDNNSYAQIQKFTIDYYTRSLLQLNMFMIIIYLISI